MRRFTMTIALTGILSVSALAGEIPFDYTPPPPPPDPPVTITTSPVDIPTGGITGETPCDGLARQAEDAAYAGFLAVVGWLA